MFLLEGSRSPAGFFLVALLAPILPHLRTSKLAVRVLDGLNVASLALMGVTTLRLTGAAVIDPLTAALALTSAVLLLRFAVNSSWLVLGGALVGTLARY